MKITFGLLITDNYDKKYLQNAVLSIERQKGLNINDYEILIAGNYKNDIEFIKSPKIIELDYENIPGWLTRKRNLIAKNASFDNVCFLQEKRLFKQGWYDGVLKFNSEDNDWDIMSTRYLNLDGTRYLDWCLDDKLFLHFFAKNKIKINYKRLLPYDIKNLTHLQIISGGYVFMKTQKAIETPFIESMVGWNRYKKRFDDEWWSILCILKKYKIKLNTYSSVIFQVQRADGPHGVMNDETLEKFLAFYPKNYILDLYKKEVLDFYLLKDYHDSIKYL